jgi:hypothetical protein
MATQYNIPKIKTENLALYLDGINTKSYPGSGTAWTDLTGRENNATIGAGPSYADGAFELTLAGDSTHTIRVPTSTDLDYTTYNEWCYSMWIYVTFNDNGTWTQLFSKGNAGGERRPSVWFHSGDTDKFHFMWKDSTNSQVGFNSSSGLVQGNTWENFVFQSSAGQMQIYRNGTLDSQSDTNIVYDAATNNTDLIIGAGTGYRTPGMKVACFMLYDGSLTAAEIKSNYEALRGRFGV